MLVKISDNFLIKKHDTFKLDINSDVRKKVEENWKDFIKNREKYYNSDIITVSDIDMDNNILSVKKAKFADLVYCKNNKDLTIRSLFSAILLKTLDGYYIIVETTYDDRLNLIGGMADLADFDGEYLNYQKCIEREMKEEMGLDLNNKNDILSFELKYLKIPKDNENFYPCGVCYTGTLNFTAEHFKDYFRKNKNKFDNEVKDVLCLTDEECLNLEFCDESRTYIGEFLELEINSNYAFE